MNHFNNIKIDNDSLYIELNNNNDIKVSLANAIRRIAIAEVPTFAMDNIEFQENSSMLHDSYLSKRLSLIPLNYNEVNKYNVDKLEVSLDKINNTDHMMDILSGDFVVTNDGQTINNIIINDKILFGKLKPGQNMKFKSKINKSTAILDGTYYTPVCKSVVRYKRDDKLIESLAKDVEDKKYFIEVEGDQHYLKTKTGEPAVYIIELDSVGHIEPKVIMTLILNILSEKLKILLDSVKEIIETKIQITLSEKLYESYNFLIFDEDHTLGNLIGSYLLDHPQIGYAGYIIPHPNDNKLLITTSLKNNNSIDGNKKVFIETIQKIIDLVNKLKIEWVTANSDKPATKKLKIKTKN